MKKIPHQIFHTHKIKFNRKNLRILKIFESFEKNNATGVFQHRNNKKLKNFLANSNDFSIILHIYGNF